MTTTVFRWITYIGLFLIPFTPLLVSDTLFFPFVTGKAFFFRIIVDIVFVAWLMLMLKDASYRPKFGRMSWVITAFVVVAFIADVFGMNPVKSIWSNFERMEGWFMLLHLWMYFMVLVSMFRTMKLWNAWILTTVGVSFITTIHALMQYAGFAQVHMGATRLDANLGNAAYFAVYILIHLFLIAYLYFLDKKDTFGIPPKFWKGTLIALAALQCFVLYHTATRGSILGFVLGIMVALGIFAWKTPRSESQSTGKHVHRDRKIALSILGGIFALGLIFVAIKNTSFVQNSPVLSRFASISITDKHTQARAFIWPMAIEGFKERPILGWGQENFNYVFNSHYDPEMWRHEQWFDRAHNVFLDWLIAGGVVGFALYIALYIILLMYIWKGAYSLKEKCALIGLVVAYAIHNFFVFDNISSYILFFSILAFGESRAVQHKKPLFEKDSIHPDVKNYALIPIVAIVGIMFLYTVDIKPLRASSTLIDALVGCSNGPVDLSLYQKAIALSPTGNQEARENLIMCAEGLIRTPAIDEKSKQMAFALAKSEVDQHIKQTPSDARMYILFGSTLNRLEQYELAIPYLTKGLELSPGKQSVMMDLGLAYIATGKTQEGLALIKKAYDSAPDYPTAKISLAAAYVYAGDLKSMDQLLAGDVFYTDSDTLVQAYFRTKNFKRIIDIYKRFVEREPNNIQARISLAAVYAYDKNFTRSIEEVRTVMKIDPNFATRGAEVIRDLNQGKNPFDVQ